jgi:hypothetical protein
VAKQKTDEQASGVIVKDRDFKAMAKIRDAMKLCETKDEAQAVIDWFRRTYDPVAPKGDGPAGYAGGAET